MTPKKILHYFGRLSDCDIEKPFPVNRDFSVRAYGGMVLLFGPNYVTAMNATDTRGLNIQYTDDYNPPAISEWKDGYRSQQRFLDQGNEDWMDEFMELPEVVKNAEAWAKVNKPAARKVEL